MSKKHTHKYHKVETSAGALWACGLPDCNHFMPSHYARLLPGKMSICWECGEQLILTDLNMRRDQPICPDCTLGQAMAHINKVVPDKPIKPDVVTQVDEGPIEEPLFGDK
jgi:hypothetical protein